ncbi:MAG: hypothetical protein QOI24_2167 [Acidobacteriota bacterium]|jgi:hypothetical protein|nr:hypothetical protein [Acidobacteriota bacterium]
MGRQLVAAVVLLLLCAVANAATEISVEPRSISFGELRAGESSEEHDLVLTSERNAIVSIALEPVAGVTMLRQDNVVVTPSAPAHVRLRLTVDRDAEPGVREIGIRIGEKLRVPSIVAIIAPPPLLRGETWIGALAIVLVPGLIAFGVYRRRERDYLEGEIEVVAPQVPPDTAFVALQSKRAKEVAISTIVPADALGGADARIFSHRRCGTKTVWIAADKGTLRVNDIDVPMTELYDSDTIEIGAATLRFNRFTRASLLSQDLSLRT